MAPHYLSSAGTMSIRHRGHAFCGHTMLQYGLSGEEWTHDEVAARLDAGYKPPHHHAPPLFVHANLLKHQARRELRS